MIERTCVCMEITHHNWNLELGTLPTRIVSVVMLGAEYTLEMPGVEVHIPAEIF